MTRPVLHLFCGRIAAGKSTLATRLAEAPGTVLIREDAWNAALWPGELRSVEDYGVRAARLRTVMGPHVVALLRQGLSVVLDFQANDLQARRWMRGLIDPAGATHVLHLLEAEDAECRRRLAQRNAAGTHEFVVSEAEYVSFMAYFHPPGEDEGFAIQRHPPC